MLTLSQLSCSRNYRNLFAELSVTLMPSSVVRVVGANGLGKTTLLEALAMLQPLKAGGLYCNDEKITCANRRDYQRSISYIPVHSMMKPEYTIRENLSFWAKLSDGELLLDAALQHFGLERYQEEYYAALSAGWQQRVKLAKLMLDQSDVWLLDEPCSYLDDEGKYSLFTLITSKIEHGGLVIIASHEPIPIDSCIELHLEDWVSL